MRQRCRHHDRRDLQGLDVRQSRLGHHLDDHRGRQSRRQGHQSRHPAGERRLVWERHRCVEHHPADEGRQGRQGVRPVV